jgi:hypothetical protein
MRFVMPEKLIPLCDDLYCISTGFLGKLQQGLWEQV